MVSTVCTEHSHLPQHLVSLMADPDVSAPEKALYAYLWTRPAGWEVRREDLAARFREGEWTVRKAISGLTERGYVKTQRLRTPDGRIWGSRMRFRPEGDAGELPGVVVAAEDDEHLAVKIGKKLPSAEYIQDRTRMGGY